MKALISITLIFISLNGFSQEFGYFGKKNTLSISGLGSIPIIYWFTNSGYANFKRSENSLIKKNDYFDGGLNLSFSHGLSGSFALGIEYNLLFGNVKGPKTGDIYVDNGTSQTGYSFYMDHEQLSIRTNVFMPKIEYTFTGNQLPFGINNQLGIGFSTTKVLEKDYLYKVYSDDNFLDTIIQGDKMINYDKVKSTKGLTIMYAFNVRTPISKHFMINYGIRYTLNLSFNSVNNVIAPDNYDNSQDRYYTKTYDIKELVADKRIASIMSFNFGINYIF